MDRGGPDEAERIERIRGYERTSTNAHTIHTHIHTHKYTSTNTRNEEYTNIQLYSLETCAWRGTTGGFYVFFRSLFLTKAFLFSETSVDCIILYRTRGSTNER